MPTARLSKKSQLVLPAEIRKKLGIRPGDQLNLEVEGEHVVLRKAPDSDVEELGKYCSDLWQGYADEIDEMRDAWDK